MYQQSDVSSNPVNVEANRSNSARMLYGAAVHVNGISLCGAEDLASEAGSGDETLHQLRSVVAELVTALNKVLQDEPGTAEECLRRAAAILDVDDPPSPAAVVQGGLAPWQIRRVTAYVEANLDKRITNGDLASLARLSPGHFNCAFRNSVGDSPHLYIIRRRIERAQGMLLSTDSSLSQIAADCGLADQAHLTRLFRRLAGNSPAAWRRARVSPRI
jgi:AraC family transcriptional regulator